MQYWEIVATSSALSVGRGVIAVRSQGMVGAVGVDAAQGYLAKVDCDGPQFREISINL